MYQRSCDTSFTPLFSAAASLPFHDIRNTLPNLLQYTHYPNAFLVVHNAPNAPATQVLLPCSLLRLLFPSTTYATHYLTFCNTVLIPSQSFITLSEFLQHKFYSLVLFCSSPSFPFVRKTHILSTTQFTVLIPSQAFTALPMLLQHKFYGSVPFCNNSLPVFYSPTLLQHNLLLCFLLRLNHTLPTLMKQNLPASSLLQHTRIKLPIALHDTQ